MMHGFGMSMGILWLAAPALVAWLLFPVIRNIVRRMSGNRLDESERRSLPGANDQAAIYRLAKRRGGKLTVSDVVVDTGMEAYRAEQLLQSMTDGLRVRMEVTDNGIVVYEFTELMERDAAGR